jgi:hypothetical protein
MAQAQAAAAPIAAPTAASKGPKVSTPTPFDGEMKNAETFFRQMTLYITAKASEFPDEPTKIIFALSYMTGRAQAFANIVIDKIERHNATPADPLTPFPFPTYLDFIQELKDNFADPDERRTAQYKLSQLRQGTKTAEEYVLEFRVLADKTDYNDVALVEKFETGINDALRRRIYGLARLPVTCGEWMMWAMRLDRQWRMYEKSTITRRDGGRPQQQQNRPTTGQQGNYRGQQWASRNRDTRDSTTGQNRNPSRAYDSVQVPAGAPNARDPHAMDVDKNKNWKQTVRCFKCGGTGHIARECTKGLDIREMTYEEIRSFFKDEEKEGKDDQDF